MRGRWRGSRAALYVGTARSAMCVENATIAYYLPDAGFYRREPLPGVTCPSTVARADLRAEIWRYEPGVGRWTRVYRSPRVPNPRAPGRLVARDIGYRGMLVRTERGGHKALYVAAFSPDEFIPELRRQRPPRILRTTDGERFRALRARPPVIHTYLGPYRPVGFRALATVGRSLYVTASAGLTGDGVVLRVRRPGGRSPSFEQVSPRKLARVRARRPSAAGCTRARATASPATACGAPTPHRPRRWESVVVGGAGRGSTITSVVSMAPYRGRLYVGASGWLNCGVPSVGADPRRARRALGGRRRQRAARRGRRPAVAAERAARRLRKRLQPALLAHAGVPGRPAARHERLELVAARPRPASRTSCARSSASTSTGRATARTGGSPRATASAATTTSACAPWPRRARACSSAPRTTTAGPRSIARGRGRAPGRPHTAVRPARPAYALPPNARRTLERERVRSDPSSAAEGSETQR